MLTARLARTAGIPYNHALTHGPLPLSLSPASAITHLCDGLFRWAAWTSRVSRETVGDRTPPEVTACLNPVPPR